MQFDPFFIKACAELDVDGIYRNDIASVFRYPDGWLVLWNDPMSPLDLGRWVKTAPDLKTMMGGHWNLGRVVRPGEEFWK